MEGDSELAAAVLATENIRCCSEHVPDNRIQSTILEGSLCLGIDPDIHPALVEIHCNLQNRKVLAIAFSYTRLHTRFLVLKKYIGVARVGIAEEELRTTVQSSHCVRSRDSLGDDFHAKAVSTRKQFPQ